MIKKIKINPTIFIIGSFIAAYYILKIVLLTDVLPEMTWGPLSQLIAGCTLAYICYKYFPTASNKHFIFIIFTYLILTKFDVLLNPPYGDPISGPWVEAIWLKHHHFDFIGLSQQSGYDLGGAKVYLFCIYPAFLALLMSLIPSVKAFLLVNHLLTFAMTAIIVMIIRHIALKSFAPLNALLIAIISLSLPLFQAQTEAINMEIPSLFFVMLTILFLSNRRFGLATLFACIGLFVKGSCLIASFTVITVIIFDFFLSEKKRYNTKNLKWIIVIIGIALFHVFLKQFFQDSTAKDMGLLAGWLAVTTTYNFKIIFWGLIASVIIYVIRARQRPIVEFARTSWNKHYPACIMMIMSLHWVSLFINFAGLSPRYKIILCGLLVFYIAFVVSLIIKSQRIMTGLLIAGLMVTLLSTYGYFENHKQDTQTAYDYLVVDRSLEYRDDLKLYKRIARDIEEKYSDFSIGAPFIMVHALALPELGYVQKKMRVLVYGNTVDFEGIEQFTSIELMDLNKTVWVGFKGGLASTISQFVPEYPIDPNNDKILKKYTQGRSTATLFMGGYAIESVQRIIYYMYKMGQSK